MHAVLTTMLLINFGIIINSASADERPFPFKVRSVPYVIPMRGNIVPLLQLIISPDDNRTVANIVINRGNCHLFYGQLGSENFTLVQFPVHFKFGLNQAFWTEGNCDLREMILYTDDNRQWTINFERPR